MVEIPLDQRSVVYCAGSPFTLHGATKLKSKEHYQRSFSDIRGTLSEADQAAEKAKVSLERYSDKIVEVLIEVIEAEPKKNA